MGVFDRLNNLSAETTGLSPSEEFMQRLQKKGYDIREMKPILETQGNQLIISCAGSGKTTTLLFKLMHDIITQEATRIVSIGDGTNVRVTDKIWVSTFLKSGAEELKFRLGQQQRELGYMDSSDGVVFSTLHAEFKRALTAMGVKLNIMSAKESSEMLNASIRSLKIRGKSGRELYFDDYSNIQSIVTYARNRLDNKKYNHPLCGEYGLTPTVLDCLIENYRQRRNVADKQDFEDLQELLYDALYVNVNPAVQQFIANRYKFIYLDEFQDTSQIQYSILKWYGVNYLDCNKGASDRGKIIALGDDDQCIYSWRGSDIDIITWQFEQDFRPVVNQLTVNYRCPANILKPIIPSINKNEKRHVKGMSAYKDGGEIYAYSFHDNKSMIVRLMKDIVSDIQDDMNVVILCRTNFDGMIPAFTLEQQHKFDFSISGENMTLNSALPRTIFRCSSLFTERTTSAVGSTLELLVNDKRLAWRLKEMMIAMKNDKQSIFTVDMDDIKHSIPKQEFIDLIETLRMYREQGNDMDGLKYIYSYLITEVYNRDNSYCENARAYIEVLLYIIDSNNFTSVWDFCEKVQEYSDNLQLRVGKPKVPIQITTVHEYKGKERDSVYIWNDSKDVFPSSKCDIGNIEELEEERRVHYIAWTRAKKKLTIYTKTGNKGMFLQEATVDVKVGETIGGTMNSQLHSNGIQLDNEIPWDIDKNVPDDTWNTDDINADILPFG